MHHPFSTLPLRGPCSALLLLTALAASAGSWEATNAAGMQFRILEDSARTPDGHVLERRHPDGRADPRFGSDGSVAFSIGPDNGGPADLRVDAAGRLWVAGGTAGPDGVRAVVLRFLPDGRPDPSFAQAGRASLAPRGMPARATEVLPMDDGSAWVAGPVLEPAGSERSGAWRVQPDGRVDPRFGLGGLWQDPEPGDAEAAGLVRSAGGVALGLRRNDGAKVWLETWAWGGSGGLPQRVARVADDAPYSDQARFAAVNGVARWLGVDGQPVGPAPAALPAAAASGAEAAAAAPRPADLVIPFPLAPAASAAPAAPAAMWPAWVLWAAAALVVAAVAIVWRWRRRRAVKVDRDGPTPSQWPPRRR